MGIEIELTKEILEKIHSRNDQKAAAEAKRLRQHYTLFTGKKLTEEEKKRVLAQVKGGAFNEKERDFKYAAGQLTTKIYSGKVYEMTKLCIDNFKQRLKDDEDLNDKYGKYINDDGNLQKVEHKLWLLERMEGYLSNDMHKRPLYSGDDTADVIFFLGTNGKIEPQQEAETDSYRPMKAAL